MAAFIFQSSYVPNSVYDLRELDAAMNHLNQRGLVNDLITNGATNPVKLDVSVGKIESYSLSIVPKSRTLNFGDFEVTSQPDLKIPSIIEDLKPIEGGLVFTLSGVPIGEDKKPRSYTYALMYSPNEGSSDA